MAALRRKSIRRARAKLKSGKRGKSRHIPEATKILLAVRAGGRCEFRGCNRYLFEHPLTLQGGNFSQHAHIVAFSELGPRRMNGALPEDIHSPDNLVLLCALCHKLIDDRPEDYPRAVVEAFKREHEERIAHVTGLGPDVQQSNQEYHKSRGSSLADVLRHMRCPGIDRQPRHFHAVVGGLVFRSPDESSLQRNCAGDSSLRSLRASSCGQFCNVYTALMRMAELGSGIYMH
jgi:HNH endonuclease